MPLTTVLQIWQSCTSAIELAKLWGALVSTNARFWVCPYTEVALAGATGYDWKGIGFKVLA